MKILYIPPKPLPPELDDLYAGFKKLADVDHWWANKCMDTATDLIYVQCGAIDRDTLAGMKDLTGARVVSWCGDYRPFQLPEINMYEGISDITYLSGYTPELYPKQNIKWMPHGVGDWQFRKVKSKTSGIAMIFNNYTHFPGGMERWQLAESLRDTPGFIGYGSGFEKQIPWLYNPEIYNDCKFATGGNIYNDVKWYFSSRPLMAMASGTCYIMRYVPGLKDLLDIDFGDIDCFVWRKIEDVHEYIKYCSDGLRNKIAEKGQQTMREKFHYDVIAKRIIDENSK